MKKKALERRKRCNNAYMQFCAQVRASPEWRKRGHNELAVPQQGRILGQMYRNSSFSALTEIADKVKAQKEADDQRAVVARIASAIERGNNARNNARAYSIQQEVESVEVKSVQQLSHLTTLYKTLGGADDMRYKLVFIADPYYAVVLGDGNIKVMKKIGDKYIYQEVKSRHVKITNNGEEVDIANAEERQSALKAVPLTRGVVLLNFSPTYARSKPSKR